MPTSSPASLMRLSCRPLIKKGANAAAARVKRKAVNVICTKTQHRVQGLNMRPKVRSYWHSPSDSTCYSWDPLMPSASINRGRQVA